MLFEEFQDGHPGGHLGYRNGTILAISNLCVTVMPPIKFQLNWTGFKRRCYLKISRWLPWQPYWISERNDFSNFESLCHCDASHRFSSIGQGLRGDVIWRFQDGRPGSHLGYRNGMILAILNLCVTVMPSIKFQLNWTGFKRRCYLKISRWLPWQPYWISERNDFSNFESLCHCDASHRFSSIGQGLRGDVIWRFQDGRPGSHLGYRNGMILAILNLCVTVMPSIKFQLNLT